MRTEDGDYLRVSAHASQNTFSFNLSTLKQGRKKKVAQKLAFINIHCIRKRPRWLVDPIKVWCIMFVLLFPNLQKHNWAKLSGFPDEPTSCYRQKGAWSCCSVGEAVTFLRHALPVSLVPTEEHFLLHIWRNSAPLLYFTMAQPWQSECCC